MSNIKDFFTKLTELNKRREKGKDNLMKFLELEDIISKSNSGFKAECILKNLKSFKFLFQICLLDHVFSIT